MIHSLATRMASVFVLYGESSEEDADIYAYACGAVLSLLANILVCLVIAFLFGRVIEGMVFIACFALLRRHAGGHHANTHLNCILAFSAILISVMVLLTFASWFQVSGIVAVVIAGIALVGIIFLAPVEHKNKVSGVEFHKSQKRKSGWLALMLYVICILNLYIISSGFGFVISLAMFFVFGSMAYATVYKMCLRRGRRDVRGNKIEG